MTGDSEPSLISTGEFSRRTRLTVKALRIYHETGLLLPAIVEENGYRRYHRTQIRTGQVIGLLRGADLSLAEIRRVVDDLEAGADAAVQGLEELLSARQRQHTRRTLLIRHIQTTLREGDDPMFEVHTRHVPACRVMSMQRRLDVSDIHGFVQEAKAAFAGHVAGAERSGPLMLIFHGPVSDESDGPLEVVVGCPEQIQPTETIGIRTEPAHDEAYTTITKAQWEYPAILAAYDAVARSDELRTRPHSRLSCREVYLADPDSIGDDEFICDVAYPLA